MIIILFYIKSYITCYYELVSHEYSRTELAKESTKGTIIINHNESDKKNYLFCIEIFLF